MVPSWKLQCLGCLSWLLIRSLLIHETTKFTHSISTHTFLLFVFWMTTCISYRYQVFSDFREFCTRPKLCNVSAMLPLLGIVQLSATP